MKKISLLALILLHSLMQAQFTKLLDFSDAVSATSNGCNPRGDLYWDGTFLYGMTTFGGTNGRGVIFKIKPDGSGYVKLHDFAGVPEGGGPTGGLISDGTFLYGMTYIGQTQTLGTIFKILPNGSGFTKIFDFTGAATGNIPMGSLLFDGTFLYGTTWGGGVNDKGVIFKIKPDGSGFVKLLDFSGTANGSEPRNSLISVGAQLYGTAGFGGVNNSGTIFKIQPDGTGFAKVFEFTNNSNSALPTSALVSDGTFFYGMTIYGGGPGKGTVFKVRHDGTAFTRLLDFNGAANGSTPQGSLIYDSSSLYGMTQSGGANNYGVVFKINTDGTGYKTLHDFDYTVDGGSPFGSLVSDGSFIYGLASYGGSNSCGTVFKIAEPVGIEENKIDVGFKIFPNPASSLITIETKNNFNDATINIYNAFGQIVKQIKNISGQRITLSKNDLSNGIYFLEIKQEDKIISTNKLIFVE